MRAASASSVTHLNRNKTGLTDKPIYMRGEKDGIDGRKSRCCGTTATRKRSYSFANNINTHEGGTHLSGFRAALTRTVNSYAAKNGLTKDLKDAGISGDDIREGLTAVISVKIPRPQFEGQTKTKLGNTEVKGIVEAIVNDKLGAYLEENPSVAKRIVLKVGRGGSCARRGAEGARSGPPERRAREQRATRKAGRPARSAIRRTASCIWLRASRPVARPSRVATGSFQAILPLRGKILNVERARFDKMPQQRRNQGHDRGARLRHRRRGLRCRENSVTHRIIIMTDADVDGSHIRTLLLTFFYRQLPELIDRGYVYIAQPPLFRAKRGKAEHYIKDERELENWLIHRAVESRVLRQPDGTELSGPTLEKLLHRLIAFPEVPGRHRAARLSVRHRQGVDGPRREGPHVLWRCRESAEACRRTVERDARRLGAARRRAQRVGAARRRPFEFVRTSLHARHGFRGRRRITAR